MGVSRSLPFAVLCGEVSFCKAYQVAEGVLL